MFLQEIAVIHI